jgi:hypothetical protein
MELIESGLVLQELLKAPYPGADAVLAAVQRIHNCRDLLVPEELERYQELFERDDDESRQSEWESLLGMFYPDDEDIGSSDNEGQANLRDDLEIDSKVMKERIIAYHQLKVFSLYLEDKPN